MRAFLVICCFVSILLSVGTCTVAKGAVHEIQGGIWLLIGVIFFVGATLLDELQRIRKGVEIDAAVPTLTASARRGPGQG